MRLIAKTLEGLEEVLASELENIGAEDILILKRAVAYTGNTLTLYKSNLLLRTCLKVLVFMKEFEIKNEDDLYNEIKKIPWEDYFDLENTFAIDTVVNSTIFKHTQFVAYKTKDAIVDRFRDKFGSRPNVDTLDPSLQINIHIRENIVTVSLDSSGTSLHMRGYRRQTVDAPLNEIMAAGLVLLSGWDGNKPLIDPMCGSATILCEAARWALNVPPQSIDRNFAFKNWKHFDTELWQMVCDEAANNIIDKPLSLFGFDSSPKAVKVARENIQIAGLDQIIKIEEEDFFYQESQSDAMIIFNPPYDGRLKEDDVFGFYKNIGDKLKHSFKGCSAWILSGHLPAMKHVGLRPSAKKQLLNGSIPSVFARFDMYDGSKKQKYQHTNSNVSE